tara:strand:- start:8611 stop:8823 length:213 start_codon:yes stop_codon:yes gene_type:complete
MKVKTYHKNGKAVQFLGYSDIDAFNAAKVVMGEVGDVGYFRPRLGAGEDIYDWVYVKETTDEDLQRVLGK